MTFATWALAVTLLAPNYPQEHRQWDMTYSPIATVQECEELAKKQWSAFYDHYQSLPGQLNTQCIAHAHGKTWVTVITCDRLDACETKKTEF